MIPLRGKVLQRPHPGWPEGATAGHSGPQSKWLQENCLALGRGRMGGFWEGPVRGGGPVWAWHRGRGLCGRSLCGKGGTSPSQSASSERSWQSASPSQRSRRSTHWPRAQGNWAAEHTGQPSSSLWSSHSGKPSQRQAPGMQSISPVAQANWSGEQVGGSGEDRNAITRSPTPRKEVPAMRVWCLTHMGLHCGVSCQLTLPWRKMKVGVINAC